ncbi:PREDICTED: larval cuticle protein LCP-17-like [Nicrophorus vespilloides]|uniref:Larval cuticle protein LCP-17-like n=1 Tax=Nicrophorus vespilloides TaxID=110193 RepID=A0ABM1NG30_NICVS|nr:PREDICTED: larval cuticle protein LCP-17-like [Nicrophorus vespilloides]
MKSFIVVLAFVAVACAVKSDEEAKIITQNYEINADGSYKYDYETGNGISAQESGVLKNAGNKDTEAFEVKGSYQYTATDGKPIKIEYVANELGYQPKGDHLPTPPPVPAAILKALEYIRAHPQPEEKKF